MENKCCGNCHYWDTDENHIPKEYRYCMLIDEDGKCEFARITDYAGLVTRKEFYCNQHKPI
jgi:hypothetical protein